jgi:hypothetical protein
MLYLLSVRPLHRALIWLFSCAACAPAAGAPAPRSLGSARAAPALTTRPSGLDIPDEVPLAELSTYFARAACPLLNGCWQMHAPACLEEHAQQMAEGIVAALRRSEVRGALSYDGREMARCLRSYAKRECPDQHPKWLCAHAFHGHVPLGERCYLSNECAGGARCDRINGCPGVCRPKADETGNNPLSSADCVEGLAFNAGTLPICYRPRQLGEECGYWPVRCADSLACLSSERGNQTCRPLQEARILELGAECGADGELSCRAGTFCSATWNSKGQCVPAATPFGACQVTTSESCPTGFRCTQFEQALRCRPWPARGESCSDAGDCWHNYGICSAGVCAAPRRESESCSDDGECLSRQCREGHCQAPSCE